MKTIITGFDSNISDKCKIQKYYLELKRKLLSEIQTEKSCNRCFERAEKNVCAIRGNE